MALNIISYNVNGIRAAMKKDLLEWLDSIDADSLSENLGLVVEGLVDVAVETVVVDTPPPSPTLPPFVGWLGDQTGLRRGC